MATTGADGETMAAFETLLEHRRTACAVAYRFTRSWESAEDVTQEAFLRAYRARERFDGRNGRAWLMRIVTNVAIDELRRQGRRQQHSLDQLQERTNRSPFEPIDEDPPLDSFALQGEVRANIERALRQLSANARLVVLLADLHGLSQAEVAAATGLPLGTVKSRRSRAHARLRQILRPDGELVSTSPQESFG